MTAGATGGRRPPRPRPGGLWRWHLWAGLAALLVLLASAISGGVLVYQKELIRLTVTPHATLPPDYSHGAIASQLQQLEFQRGAGSPISLKAPNPGEPYWTVRHGHALELLELATLDTYQDNLGILALLTLLREFHVDLLTGRWGQSLLLLCGILALFLTVSGLLLWWPGRRAFRWRWVIPRNYTASRSLQYHRHAGALVSPLLLLAFLTGSVMLWQKLVAPLLPPVATEIRQIAAMPAGVPGIARDYRAAQAAVPDGWPTYIRTYQEQDSTYTKVRFRLPGEWHLNGRTSVVVNSDTGELVISERSDQSSNARRLVNQLYPLHSGYGMPGGYRALMLVTSLALAWLAYTGGSHYYTRWRHRRNRRHSSAA
ncbi:PepSY domain-containing protein [Parahaliea maris]|uniref:PepSY domain-containing protein n=1 Tax=Parahaliea maris TaxID=2716870 RepID=A0A5C9A653_9GAMM|nr:PepSY-associated TM helix domain-containing protein [Parahaliea maris]TXS96308.1 PepSY domain-containing protein [Parahaliea maris]